MKRHPALQDLSRDHLPMLMAARRLRLATDADAGEVVASYLEYWEREARGHFRVEEEVLLPAFAVHGDVEHPLVARLLIEHVRIRRDTAALAEKPDLDFIHGLGELLGDHVRCEERQFFPLIEESLPDAALTALGEAVTRAERELKQS